MATDPQVDRVTAPALSVRGVRKEYPGTVAVDFGPDDVLEFHAGEIHALVGENGAGKSTFVKVVAGIVRATGGEMSLGGRPYAPRDAVDARRQGVEIVLQEPGLVDTMSIEDNLVLGREDVYAQRQFFRPAARRRLAQRALERAGLTLSLGQIAGQLSLEDQKFVELARALSLEPRALLIDEMTASLSRASIPKLYGLLRDFAAAGGLVIYISHYLVEVFDICDRVTVMKDARLVATRASASTTEDELSTLMVGRPITSLFGTPGGPAAQQPPVLEVRGLTVDGRFRTVDLTVHAGEIVGIGGLINCGSEALARALFGAIRPDAGSISISGDPVRLTTPGAAIAQGIGFVPSDRDREGVILGMSIERNISLPAVARLSGIGIVRRRAESRQAREAIKRLAIKCRGGAETPLTLSGGNRQKVVLAKWLGGNLRVLVLHNPTRGVDVGAKEEIYRVLRELAASGIGLVVVSDDLPELIGISDTLIVMRRGEVSHHTSHAANPTEEALIGYML